MGRDLTGVFTSSLVLLLCPRELRQLSNGGIDTLWPAQQRSGFSKP